MRTMVTTLPDHDIRPATTGEDLGHIRRLFEAYAASLDIDLSYQDFAAELNALPGKYAPPAGALYLAFTGTEATGCVALRPFAEPGICEMKRLYVTPQGRGTGLGRALVARVLDTARSIGYREIRLDTLPSMQAAITLYQSFGFREIPAYYDTPVEGTVFLGAEL